MKINIFINDKLYKTVTVQDENYNPMKLWPQIEADKESGLLDTYNTGQGLSVKVEKAKN